MFWKLILAVALQSLSFFAFSSFHDSFGEEHEGVEENEENVIQTSFECYDITSDVDRIICLDNNLSALSEFVESTMYHKTSTLPAGESYLKTKAYEKWKKNRARKCRESVSCYFDLYKKKLVEIKDRPIVAKQSLTLKEGAAPITIDFFGEKKYGGFYIDSIGHKKSQGYSKIELLSFLKDYSWELFVRNPKVKKMDVNFDGIYDISIFIGSQGKDGKTEVYFTYDEKKGDFFYDKFLNSIKNLTLDYDNELVVTKWNRETETGSSYQMIDYYGYNTKGKLVKQYRQSYLDLSADKSSNKVKRTVYKARGSRFVKVNTASINKDQIGVFPEDILQHKSQNKK